MPSPRPRVRVVRRALRCSPRRLTSDAFLSTVIYRAADCIGRDVHVEAARLPPRISAVWVSMPDRELVQYSSTVPVASAVLGVLHEVGHILCGHGSEVELQHAAIPAGLTDSLSPDLVNRFFARGDTARGSTTREEEEAEMYARIMYRRALRVFAEEHTTPALLRFNIVHAPRFLSEG